jgi:hypothetical protein
MWRKRGLENLKVSMTKGRGKKGPLADIKA